MSYLEILANLGACIYEEDGCEVRAGDVYQTHYRLMDHSLLAYNKNDWVEYDA